MTVDLIFFQSEKLHGETYQRCSRCIRSIGRGAPSTRESINSVRSAHLPVSSLNDER